MRRKARIQTTNPGAAKTRPVKWVAPTSGMNTSTPLVSMQPTTSPLLQNWFPEEGYLRSRNGCVLQATGFTQPVQTLMPYFGINNTLFAASNDNIYNVTSTGAIGTAVYTGLSTSILSYSSMSTGGGTFLWVTGNNIAQTPVRYDGTTWTTSAFTQNTSTPWPSSPSLDPTKLAGVVNYGTRLYFMTYKSTLLWVSPTDGVSTTMQLGLLDVGPNFQLGGFVAALGTWNMQTLAGPIQHLIVVSTNGEVVIFTGTDPTNSSNWGVSATFKISPPLGGMRGIVAMGSDTVIMTIDGLVSISKAFSLDPAFVDQATLTSPISPTWLQAMNTNGLTTSAFINNTTWCMQSFPHKRMLLVNFPDETSPYQFVMNTETNAWTTFNGWNINCMCVFNNVLYYGGMDIAGVNQVFQAETGGNDNSLPIKCLGYSAWDFGDGCTWRSINNISAICSYTSGSTMFLDATTEYNYPDTQNVATSIGTANAAKWDSALWDSAQWGGLFTTRIFSGTSTAPGFSFSIVFKAIINGSTSIPSNVLILGGSAIGESGSWI